MKRIKTVLCFVVAAITLLVGAYFEHINYRIGTSIYTPYSWGMLKGIFDPIFIVVFTWGVWICLIPILLASGFKLPLRTIVLLWIFITFSMATAKTIISFQDASVVILIEGVYLYTFIFGPFLMLAILISSLPRNKK